VTVRVAVDAAGDPVVPRCESNSSPRGGGLRPVPRQPILQEITVLKKAGLVVACTTAGMLAVAPMAFAKDHHHHDRNDGILSGNAVQLVQVQDLICNTSAANDLLSIISPHKNRYDQRHSCNAKNRTSGH
jgi:hypothetical protein